MSFRLGHGPRKGQLALAAVICLCGGCITGGRPVDPEKLAQVERGVSTRADVVRLLGRPNQATELDNGTTLLSYTHYRVTSKPQNLWWVTNLLFGGMNIRSDNVTIWIGTDGTVSSVTKSHMDNDVNTGLLTHRGSKMKRTPPRRRRPSPNVSGVAWASSESTTLA